MANIDNVVQRISRNTTQDGDIVREFAQDALDQASADGFTDPKLEIAAGWLGSHFATLLDNANDNVKKKTMSVMSTEYFDRGGISTFLTEYNRMLSLLNGGPNKVYFL